MTYYRIINYIIIVTPFTDKDVKLETSQESLSSFILRVLNPCTYVFEPEDETKSTRVRILFVYC